MEPYGLFKLMNFPATPFTISPGDSRVVTVRFQPTQLGLYFPSLKISSNDPDENPISVTLMGTAVETDVIVTPRSINFGNVCVGSNSEQTITVLNDGTADVVIGTIGKPSSPFSRIGGTCSDGSTLAPRGSCTIIVGLGPTSTEPFYSSMLITSINHAGKSWFVDLRRTGVVPDITIDETTLNLVMFYLEVRWKKQS